MRERTVLCKTFPPLPSTHTHTLSHQSPPTLGSSPHSSTQTRRSRKHVTEIHTFSVWSRSGLVSPCRKGRTDGLPETSTALPAFNQASSDLRGPRTHTQSRPEEDGLPLPSLVPPKVPSCMPAGHFFLATVALCMHAFAGVLGQCMLRIL